MPNELHHDGKANTRMKQRTITNDQERLNAFTAIQGMSYPYILGVGDEKTRSTAANSRYWATIREHMTPIWNGVAYISDKTGYMPWEIQYMIAERVSPQYAAILYADSEQAAHEALKKICHVPSSARLGTKKFQQFEQVMETTITEAASAVGIVVNEIMGDIA